MGIIRCVISHLSVFCAFDADEFSKSDAFGNLINTSIKTQL